MTTRNRVLTIHPALGGLDTSSDPTTLDPNALTIAENIEYLEGAQRKKRLGTAAFNAVAMISTATTVRGVADFWRYGNTLTGTQNVLAVAGASLFRSTGDGVFTALTASSSFGSAGNTTTNILVGGDFAVISDGASTAMTYDQTTLGVVSTGHPIFTGASYHLRRMFMTGISTGPSQVRYTAAGAITSDSTGADTGTFQVADGDGDQVVGVSQPFHKRLFFFKGPQYGSVHELSGVTAATFSLDPITTGAPLLNHRAIVTTATDIYWLSRHGIHSLFVTEKFGDTEQAFLSLPIQKTFRDDLLFSRLNQAWGFWHPRRNIVGWFVVPSGESTNLWALVYNYALSDPAPGGKKFWSIWTYTAFAGASGAIILTPAGGTAGQPRLYIGSGQGVVYRGDETTLSDNAVTAYTARVRTPVVTNFGPEAPQTAEKSFFGLATFFFPKGSYNADLTVTIDRRDQVGTVSMAGSGAVLDSFILDTDTLSGSDFQYAENILEDRGRSFTAQWSQGGSNQDMELFGYAIRHAVAETEPKEVA